MSTTVHAVMARGGDEDRVWLMKVFSKKEAAEEHIQVLKERNTRFKAVIDLVDAFEAHYSVQNRRPQYPEHLRVAKVKLPNRMEDITAGMREARDRAKQHNVQLDNEFSQRMNEYKLRYKEALEAFLKSLAIQQDWCDTILSGRYSPSGENAEYFVTETELD